MKEEEEEREDEWEENEEEKEIKKKKREEEEEGERKKTRKRSKKRRRRERRKRRRPGNDVSSFRWSRSVRSERGARTDSPPPLVLRIVPAAVTSFLPPTFPSHGHQTSSCTPNHSPDKSFPSSPAASSPLPSTPPSAGIEEIRRSLHLRGMKTREPKRKKASRTLTIKLIFRFLPAGQDSRGPRRPPWQERN
ncbi:hypothetical protein E2C01_066944 [Portunus trituberculatus]|uniref:Uncharacterized protein n=1 Tax=Portunus trituberculatus TaxID=210409 RepID=A0A5B7HMV9_PORTR|nr:hypothetical protein [Portunus trituberculatus]